MYVQTQSRLCLVKVVIATYVKYFQGTTSTLDYSNIHSGEKKRGRSLGHFSPLSKRGENLQLSLGLFQILHFM